MGKTQQTVIEAAGREVVITSPDKVYFPKAGYTKLDLARYYAAVAEGALRGIAARPIVLKRYVNGSMSLSSRNGPPSSAPSGSRRWSCVFRRAERRERSSCATPRSC